MADRMGSYHGAFYLAGCTVILGAAIPFILFFVQRPIAHREDIGHIEKHNIPGSDLPFHLAHVGELGASQGTQAHTDEPCGDAKSEMIDMPLASVNDMVLPYTEEGSCSDNVKSAENNNPPLLLDAGGYSGSINPAENNNNSPLLLDDVTGTSETKSTEGELISNKTKTPETLQPNTYQVEVQINSPSTSTSSVDSEQETAEPIMHDTKF